MNESQIYDLLTKADFSVDAVLTPIPAAGSDRDFFRIEGGGRTAVLMSGTGHGAALDDWVEIQRFLYKLGIGVPELYAEDLSIPAVLVEDLGDMPKPPIGDYPRIVRELAQLAVTAGREIADCPTVANRPFNFEAFREESQYFSEQYLAGFRGIAQPIIESLSSEFDCLTEELAALPKAFCHRDFQSSNITILGDDVRIIDFQSAKYGPLEYDLASLLWDSRVELPNPTKGKLVQIYIDTLAEIGYLIEPQEFKGNLFLAGVSRNMQSLGAYCFLSRVKGKKQFEKLIPPAEKNLRELIEETGILRKLKDLI